MKARQAQKIIMKLANPIRVKGVVFYTKSPSELIELLDNTKNPRIIKAKKVFYKKFK